MEKLINNGKCRILNVNETRAMKAARGCGDKKFVALLTPAGDDVSDHLHAPFALSPGKNY
jgi:hypothetical protein